MRCCDGLPSHWSLRRWPPSQLTTENAIGEGPEREVLFVLLQRFFNQEASWFQRGEGNFLMLCPLFSISAAMPIPVQRLTDFKRLGAVCGLLMIFGWSPAPISPAIFQYIIHGGNLHSLHPTFVGEWFPELRSLILDFLPRFETHFATPLHSEVATLTAHLALAVTMLFKPTLGPTTFDHREIQSFITGFQLQCRNGFNLPYANLDALRAHTLDVTLTFTILVERFLHGAGIPCPLQFEPSRGAFHEIIDLSLINAPNFRARMFAWGSPFLDNSGNKIKVGPIDARDTTYATADSRELNAANGTVLFRTCFRTARYPVQYVLSLAQAQYSPQSEPANFQEAFDYWFLRQCLLGIGRYSIM
ncbi:hypothetical protein DFH07DRAFT_1006888 [Mycena maculata]|uniref:Uncharacterized protein n=1 Tax=Mycena maculata TaxID=230809 RepID=A0AAD7JRU9_9AGAR|nr:hypothetical protein DFH07DRAFT_1006888 [Mycena maculata]